MMQTLDPAVPRAIIDLSPTLRPTSPVEQWGKMLLGVYGFPEKNEFVHGAVDEPVYYEFSTITLLDHIGPHNDAPSHLVKGGKATEELSLDRFFGKARVLDFRSKEKDQPLLRSDFEQTGIKAGEVVIAFVGYTPPVGAEELPSYAYLSSEAAEYLAGIPIKAFATDMPSTSSFRRLGELIAENPRSEHVIPEHLAFLSREIPNIEGLVGLERLIGEDHIVFVGFPLKLEGASGGIMRAAALLY
jgi:kynurenine formamidase